ncbi:MAG: chpA [Moraxellaceae bacterium]|jgi:chemosensory pili system protein ChpA (sensor histidine kinase/response regulator)|nr:chpA [Moraxellaceae bacterium]
MSDNHSFLALDWVKGEIEETLKQARQALEAFVENPEDNAQMRFCLAYLHQVHGTLQIVEFYGAALLAEEMEHLCLALTNGKVARVADGQEVLMRAILQLPPYLDRVKASRRDLPVVLLPLMNDLRAVRGEPLLSETALFTPDLDAGENAPIQISTAGSDDASLLKKIRQAYQLSLVGFIRNDAASDNLQKMAQVFARLEGMAGATPIRELWQVAAAIVEGLRENTIEAGTAVKMLLGQVDRQLRLLGEDVNRRAPTDLLKNLLYYVARSTGETPRLKSVKELYRLDDALPGDALVNEERARMHGPDREAMKSVVDALCEELGRVKDALDLFVRKSDADKNVNDLTSLVPILKQVADTVAVLGLGQPRRILQEQIEAIDRIGTSGMLPLDGALLDIAGALLYVEATLMGMIAEKPLGVAAKNTASEFSAQDQLSDAQSAVLRESRSALEKAKDAVIEYIASQWNPSHLQSIPELIDSVRGSLAILQLPRPASVLGNVSRYISERLLAGQHRPDWMEMDTLADVITSVEYYLERIANDTQGGEHILDIAERGLDKLGFGPGSAAPQPAAVSDEAPAGEADTGEWGQDDAAAFEAEMADALAPPPVELPVEMHEHEVLIGATDDTVVRAAVQGADELKEMQERLHVGDFGEIALDEEAGFPSLPVEEALVGESTGLKALESELGLDGFDDFDLAAGADDTLASAPVLADDFASLEPVAPAAAGPVQGDGFDFPDVGAGDDFSALEGADELPALDMAEDLLSLDAVDEFPSLDGGDEFAAPEMDADSLAFGMPAETESALDTGIETAFATVVDSAAEAGMAIDASSEADTAFAATADDAGFPSLEEDFAALEDDFGLGETATVPEPVLAPEPEPVAVAAPAPMAAPAEAPKKPILPVLTQMPSDDYDFDEEIREIFVEEAEEVMQNISDYFPKWAANFDDTASLLEFRRGFHTLKGSGRMVGARVVGELAWAFESMINKVRDKVLQPDQVMVNLISEVLAVIPGLVEDFWNKRAPRINTGSLMAAADAISRGEKLDTMDVARAAEQAQGLSEPENDEGAQDEFDALAASLAPGASQAAAVAEEPVAAGEAEPDDAAFDEFAGLDEATPEAPVVAGAFDEFAELLDDIPAPEVALAQVAPADEGAGPDSAQDGGFASLDAGDDFADLESMELAEAAPAASDDEDLATLEQELEALSSEELGLDTAGGLDAATQELTLEDLTREDVTFDEFADAGNDAPAELAPMTSDSIDLLDGAELQEAEPQLEALSVAEAAAVPDEPEIDPMLLEIFSGEAEMHLDSLREYFDGVDPERNQATISDEVLRSLHTLKGSAGMAGITQVADIAAPLEHLFKDLRNQVGHARREHLQVLRDGHAMISAGIANLGQGGNGHIAGADELIARIRQLDHDRLAHLEREQAERLDIDTSAMTAATQGLVASFMELGIDNVLDAPWELESWLTGVDARSHIQVLQEELRRLAASSRQKDVEPLAQLCDRMAAVYDRLAAQELAAEGDVLNDLASAHEEVINVFDTLAASQTVQANDSLLSALLDLLEVPALASAPVPSDEPGMTAFEPEVQPSLGELVTEGDGAGWEEASTFTIADSVDPELLEIFLEEADEVLEAAQEELDKWRRDNDNTPALAALQRHLHTLKGGARLSEIRTLGDLAHELEFLYEGLVDGRYPASPDLVDLLQRCHDRLADMVSDLRGNGQCPSGIDLVNAINAYRRDPSAGVQLSGAIAAVAGTVAAPKILEAPVEVAEATVPAVADEDNDALFAEFFPQAAAQAAAVEAVAAPAAAPVAAPVPVAEAQDFDPELLEIFLEEAGEIVDATSEQLADWKKNPDNSLPVQQLQRGLHTLKGGARMAEIVALGDLAHHLENLYERVCGGLMTPTPVLFTLLHRCHDRLAESVESLRSSNVCPDGNDLIQQITAYIADPEHFQDVPSTVTLKAVAPAAPERPVPVAPPVQRAIEAAPVPENVDSDILAIFMEESEELAEGIESAVAEWLDHRDATAPMEALMRHLHTLKGGARLAGLKALGDLAHNWETDLVAIQSGGKKADDEFFGNVHERIEAVLAGIKAVRASVEAAPAPAAAPAAPASAVTAPAARTATNPAQAPAVATRAPAPRSATPPSMLGGFKKDAAARGPQEMIRVPSDLLEKLVNLAGETSITRSRVEMGVHGFAQTVEEMGATIQRLADQLRRMDSEMETQIVARHNDEAGKYEDFDPLEMDQYSSLNQLSKALSESASDLLDLKSTLIDKARDTETLLLQQARINTELQEGLMRSRMVPFSRLVPRLKRIVRQTGQEVNKPADLDVINPDGEMDRTLLERIVAPLEHMLRNAVDHGLEDAAGRAAAGKVAQGRVTLTLAREGGEVVLTLADDGRGINIAAVRKKALERGLITEGQDIADQDVIQFIFHAGFSTAAAVTQVSGRGVGMDVVQSEIKQMGGTVSIHSITGQGTTFVIRLPFTVAVNRALMVRIGEDIYAIPLAQIEGIVRASPYELETYYGPEAPLFEYASVTYKLSYLGEFVHGVKSPNLVGQTMPLPVLLIRGSDQRVAIQVDQLIGSREIVVKAVGSQLATVAGLSGATILGDGSVVIILDVNAMLRAASLTQPRISVGGADALSAPAEVKRTRQVMVVDDSVTVRKVTSRLLERHGYEVLLAKDGMDAIAKLEDARPDVMLLDIEMPRMDGFEVATLVRHNPHLEGLPIIMITSRTGEKHRERAFQIGVNAYMGKPFNEEQLLETIGELLAATTVK